MNRIRRLLAFIVPSWRWSLLAVALGALTIGASISLLATSALLISTAALHPSIAELQVAIVGVRFFGISRGVLRYAERLVSHNTTFRLLGDIRVWFYRAIEPLAPARFASHRSGDLLARIITDIETLENFYVRVLAPPLVALVALLGTSVFMGGFAPRLALVLLAFLLLAGLGLTALTLGLGRGPGRALVESRARLRADLVDGIQGLPDLLVYGQAEGHFQRLRQAESRLHRAQRRMARLTGLQSGLNTLLAGLGAWCVLRLAIPLVSGGEMQGVHLAVVALAAMASFEAVQNLPQAAQYLEGNLQAAGRLFEVADAAPEVIDPPSPASLPLQAAISVRDLHFTYPGAEQPTLDGISFELPPGKQMALVGPSGAGKSTLASLLLRFWDAPQGAIHLAGRDIRDYAQEDVRRRFGVVSQQAYLFHASLRENLLLANPSAAQDGIEAACKQAQLHDFIGSLPQGYETYAGERGVQLSGGERQRLAIARALLTDAGAFIFDEPTANLDTVTERQVIAALGQATRGRSLLWITHRLVGLEGMDEILVLDSGRIVQRGTHAGLATQDGLYRKMWELQNRVLFS
ncbi:MAG: thiol reductant ABC exporter subunit CydC [Chloroflexi bacterium]|nr:thiol reductant ABC exporter subunit CydC [Chloroflexota bacterium]